MSSLFLYSIKSAIVLALLYLPYTLMLRQESFFRFNRMVLLSILLLALVLPLCNVPVLSLDHQPVVQTAQVQMLELGIPIHVLPEVQVMADGTAGEPASRVSLFLLVSLIYIIGMALLLIVRLWQVGRLQLGLRRGALWHQDDHGIRIYCHASDVAPFSWMHSIVISRRDWDEAGREIVLHETGHIRACHSWDVVLLTAVQALQWWNPLAYLLGISLRDVHEYEADNFVLQSGVSASAYQLLLIKKAVGSGSYAFANGFKHSLTKKRITMMKKKKSSPWMRAAALYVIPMAAMALSAFATPRFIAPVEDKVSQLEGKVTKNFPDSQAQAEEKSRFSVERLKSVPDDASKRYLLNGRDVTAAEAQALDQNDIKAVYVLRGDAPKELLGRETVLIETKDSPNPIRSTPWPGRETNYIEMKDSIYNVVAQRANYPGGDAELMKFISEHIRYPKLCHYFGFQGRVLVQFVVEKDGSVTGIKKLRGAGKKLSEVNVTAYKKDNPDAEEQPVAGQDLGDLLYEEAVRVLKLMPKWEPARDEKAGAVRSRFVVPVIFRLN